MARATGTISTKALIERGVLHPDEPLILRRRSQPAVTAVLTSAGTIQLDEVEYATPTTAARAALNGKPTNGWDRWRVPRLDDQTLTEVRNASV
jgi:hypothetical protein